MRSSLPVTIGIVLASSTAIADDMRLAGSLWQCTRAVNQSQFIITFYAGGGVGGGEFENSEVSPYIFDASRTGRDQWPGRWSQTNQRFTWSFPDQNKDIEGHLIGSGASGRLSGTETASGQSSTIECTALATLPKIGEGLVVPEDSRLIELNGADGELKGPAGISLQEPVTR